ncbi:MAG: hypothetical protein JRH20_32970, partial [Deltaproteobacteria bacterium]|nr:hypothetical protein [Deltaproteobacteria bacterium]
MLKALPRLAHLLMSLSLWVTLGAALNACTESRTGFDVSVVVDASLKIEQMIFSVEVEGQSTDPLLTHSTANVLLVVP